MTPCGGQAPTSLSPVGPKYVEAWGQGTKGNEQNRQRVRQPQVSGNVTNQKTKLFSKALGFISHTRAHTHTHTQAVMGHHHALLHNFITIHTS
jgi:hypothetical protein